MQTTQEGASLELELDRVHWTVVGALKDSGAHWSAADVDRWTDIGERYVLAASETPAAAVKNLMYTYMTAGHLYGAGRARLRRLDDEDNRRNNKPRADFVPRADVLRRVGG